MIRKLDYIIKNLDFKKKIFFSVFIVLSFMIMGYATYSTSLFATGGTEITQDYENFKVIIDKVIYDGYINEINNDNVSFSFTTNLSDDLTESDVYVELFNDSEQYDVNATLLCDAVSDSTYSITLDKSQFRLNAKTKDVVNIKLNKLGEFTNKTINCQFTIEGLEKNELANDYTEDAPSSNEILVERSSDSDNKTLKEELDELRRMAKNRETHIGDEFVFNYVNSAQRFNVPYDGNYKIELWGAQGSSDDDYDYSFGGYTSGIINLSKSDYVYIYTGEVGSNSSTGFNGGGSGKLNETLGYRYGGGATDIRYFGTSEPSLTNLNWDSDIGLNSRIMVAAGGGGGGKDGTASGVINPSSTNSANAGGLIGSKGTTHPSYPDNYATGGTQLSGGTVTNYSSSYSAGTNGSFGKGGVGGGANTTSTGRKTGSYGGGAGYYGGAGGSRWAAATSSGAGGSSYISGHAGCLAIAQDSTSNPRNIKSGCSSTSTSVDCSKHYSGKYFTDTIMIDGSGHTWTTSDQGVLADNLMPNPSGGTYDSGKGHSGNGYAKITYLGNN